ncbi:MAG: TetR/AcrR family transcriptional regulator [Anaerolineae bacterium]|nr:TetR/AcrR family transcriptional regulator [Anaerolineae bacterium]
MEKRDTKLAIINAAVEIFARKGFERTTVDEVAAQAKLAKGTIFYNFKSKDDIFFAIIEEGTRKFSELVSHRISNGRAIDRLEQAYDAAFEFFQKHNDFCTILVSELWRVRTRWNYEPHLLDAYKQHLEEIFLEGQQNGEFRRDIDSKDIGLLVFFIAAVNSLSKTLSDDNDPEKKLFKHAKLIFLKGIMAD